MQPFTAIYIHLQPFSAIYSHLQPFPAIQANFNHLQLFTAIYSNSRNLQPFTAIPSLFQPFKANYSIFLPFPAKYSIWAYILGNDGNSSQVWLCISLLTSTINGRISISLVCFPSQGCCSCNLHSSLSPLLGEDPVAQFPLSRRLSFSLLCSVKDLQNIHRNSIESN